VNIVPLVFADITVDYFSKHILLIVWS